MVPTSPHSLLFKDVGKRKHTYIGVNTEKIDGLDEPTLEKLYQIAIKKLVPDASKTAAAAASVGVAFQSYIDLPDDFTITLDYAGQRIIVDEWWIAGEKPTKDTKYNDDSLPVSMNPLTFKSMKEEDNVEKIENVAVLLITKQKSFTCGSTLPYKSGRTHTLCKNPVKDFGMKCWRHNK